MNGRYDNYGEAKRVDDYAINQYEKLGLEPEGGTYTHITTKDIKKAYISLAMRHHPDKGGDAETFKPIQTAYEILADSEKRLKLDQAMAALHSTLNALAANLKNNAQSSGSRAAELDMCIKLYFNLTAQNPLQYLIQYLNDLSVAVENELLCKLITEALAQTFLHNKYNLIRCVEGRDNNYKMVLLREILGDIYKDSMYKVPSDVRGLAIYITTKHPSINDLRNTAPAYLNFINEVLSRLNDGDQVPKYLTAINLLSYLLPKNNVNNHDEQINLIKEKMYSDVNIIQGMRTADKLADSMTFIENIWQDAFLKAVFKEVVQPIIEERDRFAKDPLSSVVGSLEQRKMVKLDRALDSIRSNVVSAIGDALSFPTQKEGKFREFLKNNLYYTLKFYEQDKTLNDPRNKLRFLFQQLIGALLAIPIVPLAFRSFHNRFFKTEVCRKIAGIFDFVEAADVKSFKTTNNIIR